MNNLKYIRELYGATQDEIAKVLNINRATISNWENQEEKKAPNSSLEKLSLFYGIGPEFFYEQDLNATVREMLVNNAKRQKEVESESNGERSKTDDFSKMFSSLTFDTAIEHYMTATKLLLATSDNGSLEKLKTAIKINQKMGARLQVLVELREQELNDGGESLSELMDSLSSEN